jgi:hypothetical protein
MSVTDAFRLLNSSLRGIREDRRRHEETKLAIETDRAKFEAEMNDPSRRLKREQDAEKISQVEFDSGIVQNPDNATLDQTFAFNQSREMLNEMMPEGTELSNKGFGVYKGTNTRVRMSKWKSDELRAQIGIAMAMQSGKADMNAAEIKDLDGKISLLDAAKKENRTISPADKIRKSQWEARRSKLIEKRDDPKSYGKMIADDNIDLFSSLNIAYRMPTKNEKLINQLHKKIELNNTMLKSLEGSTGLKPYTYTLKLKGGATKQRTEYFSPGQKIPERIRDSQGSWSRGSYKAAKGKTGNELLEMQRQDTIRKESSKIRQKIFALENEEGRAQFITDRLSEGEGTSESWEEFFRTANPVIIKELKKELRDRDLKYGDYAWYGKKKDPLGWRK